MHEVNRALLSALQHVAWKRLPTLAPELLVTIQTAHGRTRKWRRTGAAGHQEESIPEFEGEWLNPFGFAQDDHCFATAGQYEMFMIRGSAGRARLPRCPNGAHDGHGDSPFTVCGAADDGRSFRMIEKVLGG